MTTTNATSTKASAADFDPALNRARQALYRFGALALLVVLVAEYVAGPTEEDRRRALEWITSQEGPVGSPEEIKKIIEDAQYEDILKSLETD